ncbi:MAG TPA: cupredoxin domain-containing protein [Chryseolinea sp.]|nr:cupredoxin domain-containing protein [Chryseolinea sp.]
MIEIGRPVIFIILLFFSCTPASKKDSEAKQDSVEDDIAEPPRQQDEPKTHIVEIKQMKFEPAEIKVHKGDRVLWINKDITNHDVTELSKKAWASSPLSTGQSWSMTVTQSEDYFCNLHQVMKGKIIVE